MKGILHFPQTQKSYFSKNVTRPQSFYYTYFTKRNLVCKGINGLGKGTTGFNRTTVMGFILTGHYLYLDRN